MEIVIIGQNEGSHIHDMLESLRKYDYRRIWVLDRCNDGSEEILIQEGEYYVKTDAELDGRQTSHARNLGLAHCSPESDVLFLDGDRFLVSGSLDILVRNRINLLLLEDDFRAPTDRYSRLDCVYDMHAGHVMNYFFSCGIYIPRKDINKITKFQNGELFCEDLQDEWGVEDTYLGDVCYHLGIKVMFEKRVRLNGCFEKTTLDSMSAIKKRFEKREMLNVNW